MRFRKMHGLGNDFVVIDARGARNPVTRGLARALGDRRRGVGFDQLVLIGDPTVPGAAARLGFWNADGSEAGACGNGTRCAARVLFEEVAHDRLTVETAAGLLECTRAGDLFRVNMGPPALDWQAIPLAYPCDTRALPIEGSPAAVGMGNPHCVFVVPDIGAVDLEREGPRIETHPLFPERTNVEFVQVLAHDRIRMRVWERGGLITPACGSGACAAAVATARAGLTGREVRVILDGGPLDIEWTPGGVWMTGPAAHVFDGELSAEFLEA
ncbi:MAG: diaminopimelate epimerase [Paracoccaceae bacterium]|nr:MAG: diaminopimelate epimerase [Paracoccaceae bacterium]